jgi:hypothetical protein
MSGSKETKKDKDGEIRDGYFARMIKRARADKKQFIFYTVLRLLVIVTMVRCFIVGEYENVALCILSLVLFMMPSLIEDKLKLEIPKMFENIIYLFIYASGILGEIQNYYELIPGWDTMLHTMNGFLCAAVGFSMVDLLNRGSSRIDLSPKYVALVAFCFSMTIGVLWEFIEFSVDWIFHIDMQKDAIVSSVYSVKLNQNIPGHLERVHDITRTVIKCSSGKKYVIDGGYLDIGLIDTMKDLFVNFFGALAFTVIGYNYIQNRSDRNITPEFMIHFESGNEVEKDGEKGFVQGIFGNKPALTAWAALFLSAAAAILLYPMGNVWLNTMLIISISCVIGGLLAFIFTRAQRTALRVWTAGGLLAAGVVVIKWAGGSPSNYATVLMYLVIVTIDLFLIGLLWRQFREQQGNVRR